MNDYARITTYAQEAERIVECLQQPGVCDGSSIFWPEDTRLQAIVRAAEEYLARPMSQADYEWLMEVNFSR